MSDVSTDIPSFSAVRAVVRAITIRLPFPLDFSYYLNTCICRLSASTIYRTDSESELWPPVFVRALYGLSPLGFQVKKLTL